MGSFGVFLQQCIGSLYLRKICILYFIIRITKQLIKKFDQKDMLFFHQRSRILDILNEELSLISIDLRNKLRYHVVVPLILFILML